MTTRRATGGNIRHHAARGLWEARYTGADGRRHSLYGKTRAEAQERLRAALTEADHGIRPANTRTTVAAYLDEWLASSVAVRVRPSTASSLRGNCPALHRTRGRPHRLGETDAGARRPDARRPQEPR